MNIYTGYYAKLKKYKEAGLIPVAISRGVPDFCQDIDRLEMFQPSFQTLIDFKYNRITVKEYTQQYGRDILYYLDAEMIYEMLDKKYKGQDIVLLCYESPHFFCHRHLVAQWFNNSGIPVKEYE